MSEATAEAEETAEAEVEAAPEPQIDLLYDVPVVDDGQLVLHPSRETLIATVSAMKDDGWISALDLFGVDYLTATAPRPLPEGVQAERFELVITLIHHQARRRARLRVQVPASDPVVPSLFDLHPGTEAAERETWDMFGIGFEGHPLLTRILLPEDWQGHPLRKDYDVGGVPVQFKLKGAR